MRTAALGVLLAALAACEAEADPCARCASDERCSVAGAGVSCEAVCAPPRLPRFAMVPVGTTLTLPTNAEFTSTWDDKTPATAADWRDGAIVRFERVGTATVKARWKTLPAACTRDVEFVVTYQVVEQLPDADALDAYDAVAGDDPRIVAWASGWARPARFGDNLEGQWRVIERALGPATGLWHDAVSLGNGGALTFTFDAPFGDTPGLDLVVFENGFSSAFLELAFIEVSSDGEAFARFPGLSLQTEPVAAYGTLDASEVVGVAGRYAGGYGTGFDLAQLADDDLVLTGRVDLSAIAFVRVLDIVGDGQTHDCRGQSIYDPTPTFGPAGFDVEAIGVMRSTGFL